MQVYWKNEHPRFPDGGKMSQCLEALPFWGRDGGEGAARPYALPRAKQVRPQSTLIALPAVHALLFKPCVATARADSMASFQPVVTKLPTHVHALRSRALYWGIVGYVF